VSTFQVIDPRGLTAVQWTDFMILQLDPFAELPSIDSEDEWRIWALVANQSPAIAKTNPPDPWGFNDWREWAMRFNQVVDLVSNT
jgi:hypothetical protein